MTINALFPIATGAWIEFLNLSITSGAAFPVYADNQAAAFTYIQTQLNTTNLRADYYDLDIDLNTYFTKVAVLSAPGGVSASDWTTVQDQIENELSAALNVQLLFTNITSLLNEIFISDSITVGFVQNILDADESDSATISPYGVVADFLATLAGLASSGASSLLSAMGAVAQLTGLSTTSITAEVGQLQAELESQFTTLITEAAKMETNILQTWGNLQLVNDAIQSGFLAITPTQMAEAVSACQNAYELDLWQALLPLVASPAASGFSHSSSSLNSSGSDCVTMQSNGWAGNSGYHAYWLSIYSVYWWNPPTASCDRMFNTLGISKDDVMNGANGWPAPVQTNVFDQDPSCVPSSK